MWELILPIGLYKEGYTAYPKPHKDLLFRNILIKRALNTPFRHCMALLFVHLGDTVLVVLIPGSGVLHTRGLEVDVYIDWNGSNP